MFDRVKFGVGPCGRGKAFSLRALGPSGRERGGHHSAPRARGRTGQAGGNLMTGPAYLARAWRRGLLPLLALLGACAVPALPPAAPAVDTGLVGVWCNSNDAGATCWAYDEFRADGSFTACGRTDDDPRPFIGEGRYTVEGARMCYVVTRASANFWLPPGSRYCTDIVAMSPTTHRYRDLDTGAEFELTRVPTSRRRCDATP